MMVMVKVMVMVMLLVNAMVMNDCSEGDGGEDENTAQADGAFRKREGFGP